MTGSAPVLDRPALRAALSHMQIELPGGTGRFEEVLAGQQGWSLDFAERVTDEYCGFLYLAATAGFEVTPSRAVDEAWHLHLSYPHYREVLCRKILGRHLEHRPATGEPDDEERCRRQYEETLALYEAVFGKPPPPHIWPSPVVEDEEDDLEAAGGQRGKLSRRVALGSLIGSGVALAAGAPAIGVVLAGAALLFFLIGQPSPRAADRRSSGCGGGGCGGGGGSSSDDCGSGCGAGSCGGGCGGGGD